MNLLHTFNFLRIVIHGFKIQSSLNQPQKNLLWWIIFEGPNLQTSKAKDEHSEYLDLPKTVSGALIGAQGWGKKIRRFLHIVFLGFLLQENSNSKVCVWMKIAFYI